MSKKQTLRYIGRCNEKITKSEVYLIAQIEQRTMRGTTTMQTRIGISTWCREAENGGNIYFDGAILERLTLWFIGKL